MSGLYKTSQATPDAAHGHDAVCEENYYGDPAPVATAVCPRAGDARAVARPPPPPPGAKVQWLIARAAPPAGGPAVGVVPARARAAHGRGRTQLVPSRPG